MFGLFKKSPQINTTKVVNKIVSAVFEAVKPYGFERYGRTLHRFVSGDISQVIDFQSGMRETGMKNRLYVNIGIRIPECQERIFDAVNDKNYYEEYECTIRSRLGTVSKKREACYDLTKSTDKIIKSILDEIERLVIPTFEILQSRENILAYRRRYPSFDEIDSTLLLDECMIYGYLGDIEKARELFEKHYQSALDEYNEKKKNGTKFYLKKGQRIVCGDQDITAKKSGYVTLYCANNSHIEYLDGLAKKLGFN